MSEVSSDTNLAALRKLAETGQLTPVIDRTHPLAEAPAEIAYLQVDYARAKVGLTVD